MFPHGPSYKPINTGRTFNDQALRQNLRITLAGGGLTLRFVDCQIRSRLTKIHAKESGDSIQASKEVTSC